jgi:hypothetical protein
MEAISDFSPWSLLFLAHDDSHRYIKYVLQAINAFEVLYWITLAVGIKSTLRISFKDGLVIVGKSYGLGLLMWIVLICFFLIQIS